MHSLGDKTRCCSGCRRGCWGQLNRGGISSKETSIYARYQVQASMDSAQTGAKTRRMAEPSRRGSSSDLSSASSRAPGRGAEIASSLDCDCHPSSCCHQPNLHPRQRWTPPEPEQPIRLARDGISAKILPVPLGRAQPRGWAPARGLVIAE